MLKCRSNARMPQHNLTLASRAYRFPNGWILNAECTSSQVNATVDLCSVQICVNAAVYITALPYLLSGGLKENATTFRVDSARDAWIYAYSGG